jgi:hypothetical protein
LVCRYGYTESIIYMPHCYFVNDHQQSAAFVLDPEKCPKYGSCAVVPRVLVAVCGEPCACVVRGGDGGGGGGGVCGVCGGCDG